MDGYQVEVEVRTMEQLVKEDMVKGGGTGHMRVFRVM